MGIFTGIDISASALTAERLRLEVLSNNMANADSLREDGQRLHPYRRRTPVFYTGAPEATGSDALGVRFAGVLYGGGFTARPSTDPERDPDAVTSEDAQSRPELAKLVGMNLFPEVKIATEMVDMMEAGRAYEANLTAMQLSRSMIQSTMQILA